MEVNNAAAARISAADDAKSLKGRLARTAGAGTLRAKAEAAAADDRAVDPVAAAVAAAAVAVEAAQAVPVTKPGAAA
jgi:hypothetical protein